MRMQNFGLRNATTKAYIFLTGVRSQNRQGSFHDDNVDVGEAVRRGFLDGCFGADLDVAGLAESALAFLLL